MFSTNVAQKSWNHSWPRQGMENWNVNSSSLSVLSPSSNQELEPLPNPDTPHPPIVPEILHRHFQKCLTLAAYSPIPPNTSPSVLRRVLAVATKISLLTSSCLAEHMRHCLYLWPSHDLDKQSKPLPSEWAEYLSGPGQLYRPHSSGPPSGLEMQRATRAFWSIELYMVAANAVFIPRTISFVPGTDDSRHVLDAEGLGS